MGEGNHAVIKSICFAHSSFQKERVKQCSLIKKRENLSHTHQSMNTYHVNKWLIFQRWHCGAMRMQSCYFLCYWFGGSFVGIFVGQSGTQESLGIGYLKFILQLKVPISKWFFFCLDAHVNIRQDYSEWKTGLDSHDWSEQSYKKHVLWAVATKLREGFASYKTLRWHPEFKYLTPKHCLWSSTFRNWHSSWGAWLHSFGTGPSSRQAIREQHLTKVPWARWGTCHQNRCSAEHETDCPEIPSSGIRPRLHD